jgi:hypothetical protein
MSMDVRLAAVFDVVPTPVAVFRRLQWCWFWGIFGVAAGLLAADKYDQLVAASIIVYALQGLIAEGLGLRISRDGISVPRRVHAFLPQFVLWRASGSLEKLEYVTSVSKVGGGSVAILRWRVWFGDSDHVLKSQ